MLKEVKESKYNWLTYLLPLLVTISVFTTDLYLTSMPHLAEVFSTSAFNIQCTLSVYLIGFAFAMLLGAPLSERYGVRRIILTVLLIYIITSLLIIWSPSIEWFIFARFLQSFGGGFCSILSRLIVRQEYPKEEQIRIFANLFTAMGLSTVFAPILGSTLFYYCGWKANFICMSIYSLFLFIICYFVLPSKKNSIQSTLFNDYHTILQCREYVNYIVIAVFLWTGFMSFVIKAPFIFITTLGVSPLKFGYLYSIVISGLIAGSLFSKKYRGIIELKRGIFIGTTISLVATLFLSLGSIFHFNYLSIVIPMTTFLFGMGIVLPCCQALATNFFDSNITGKAFGLMYFLKMIGAVVGGTIFIKETQSIYPFVILITCLSACSFVLFQLNQRNSKIVSHKNV